MVKIYHIVKKSNCDTQFRTAILKAIVCAKRKDPNIKIYIASGFFSERAPVPVSDFTDSIVGVNLKTLLNGLTVEIYGAYNGKDEFFDFCKSIKSAGASISVFYKSKFHTKLFIIESAGKVIFEIIGSSNLTTCAYEGRRYIKTKFYNSYNSECDLILIDDMIDLTIDTNQNVMLLKYDKNGNNISIDDRMKNTLYYLKMLKESMADETKNI